MIVEARQATLDDWPGLKELWQSFQNTRFTKYIQAELSDLGHYLTNSLNCPDRIGLLVLTLDEKIVGITTLCAVVNPQLHHPGMPLQVNGFIHVAYITPGVPSRCGVTLSREIDEWCRVRNCQHVFGHVRMDGNFNAFLEKYGFDKWHYVIGREVGKHHG